MGTTADDPRHPANVAKRFGRRSALAALGTVAAAAVAPRSGQLGAAAAAEAPPAQPVPATAPRGPLRPLAFPTTPRAFSRDEMATLGHLVETILPATDTPGARDAGVHWFLDDVASQEPETRARLAAGLVLADRRAQASFDQPYAALPPGQQDTVMAALAVGADEERTFYRFLRARVVDAYYKSEMGLLGELHWTGHEFHVAFPGRCTHQDPLGHERPRWSAPDASGRGA